MATISSLLADHVSPEIRSVDHLFLPGYVPRLMTEGRVIRFLLDGENAGLICPRCDGGDFS